MTRITPRRLIILQFLHIFLTDALTFITNPYFKFAFRIKPSY